METKEYHLYEVFDGNCFWIMTLSLSETEVETCKSLCKQVNGLRVMNDRFLSVISDSLKNVGFWKRYFFEDLVRDEKKDVLIDLRSEFKIPSYRHYNWFKKQGIMNNLEEYPADGEPVGDPELIEAYLEHSKF